MGAFVGVWGECICAWVCARVCGCMGVCMGACVCMLRVPWSDMLTPCDAMMDTNDTLARTCTRAGTHPGRNTGLCLQTGEAAMPTN